MLLGTVGSTHLHREVNLFCGEVVNISSAHEPSVSLPIAVVTRVSSRTFSLRGRRRQKAKARKSTVLVLRVSSTVPQVGQTFHDQWAQIKGNINISLLLSNTSLLCPSSEKTRLETLCCSHMSVCMIFVSPHIKAYGVSPVRAVRPYISVDAIVLEDIFHTTFTFFHQGLGHCSRSSINAMSRYVSIKTVAGAIVSFRRNSSYMSRSLDGVLCTTFRSLWPRLKVRGQVQRFPSVSIQQWQGCPHCFGMTLINYPL